MKRRTTAALLAGATLGLAAVAAAQPTRDPGVVFERLLLLDEEPLDPFTDELRLPSEDEVRFARALSLIRTARADEGLAEVRALIERHPLSRRLIASSSMALARGGRPEEALTLIEQAVARQKDAWLRGELGAATVPAGEGEAIAPPKKPAGQRSAKDLYARERAEALLALGRVDEAIPYAVAAADINPRNTARMRQLLFDWAARPETAKQTVEAAAKRSAERPDRIDLALLTAEIELRAGRAEQAFERLRRTETRTDEALKGRLARVLAQRLAADPAAPPEFTAATWLEVARGRYDERLRLDALQRLIAPDPAPVAVGGSAPQPVARVPLADIEAAWRSLPSGDDRTRVGLALLEEAERTGDGAVAARVRAEVAQAPAGAGFGGALAVQRGLAALERGDLDEASRSFQAARANESGATALQAEYLLAEIEFYAGRFDSALTAFDAFARAHAASPLANDALDRAYLLEAEGGASPGLQELAAGLFAERRRQWDVAAKHARDAEAHAASTPAHEGAPPPVRAHALLLLSRAEEGRGSFDAALAAALLCADSLSADRLAPAARKRAGDLLLAHGRAADALVQYEELLARHPRSWLASEVRRKVDALRAARNP